MITYSDEDLEKKIESITEQYINKGWDGVLQYRYDVTASNETELLRKLLDQPELLSPDQNPMVIPEGVSMYGPGSSFYGLRDQPYPATAAVVWAHLSNPDNQSLREAAGSVMGAAFLESADVAEQEAITLLKKPEFSKFKDSYRGFLRVMIPYKKAYHAQAN